MDKPKTETRIYHIWNGMIGRCERQSYNAYDRYGKRGILVCEEWHDFEEFKSWAMKNGYAEDLTIDRVDPNGNYEPSNCRWVTMKDQQNNKLNNHVITFDGETKTVSQWAEALGIRTQTLFSRLKRHWDIEKALTAPVRGYKR